LKGGLKMALTYVNLVILTLANLAGLVVAIILLTKVKGTPAILAAVAFGLAFLHYVGWIMRTAFLDRLIFREMNYSTVPWASGGLNCCCGIFQLAAIVCLIIAIWQAVSGDAVEETLE
jgi:hypothetical protein